LSFASASTWAMWSKSPTATGWATGLRPDDLFPHDQDHYRAVAANDELAKELQSEKGRASLISVLGSFSSMFSAGFVSSPRSKPGRSAHDARIDGSTFWRIGGVLVYLPVEVAGRARIPPLLCSPRPSFSRVIRGTSGSNDREAFPNARERDMLSMGVRPCAWPVL
jgi:hypothetical protein